MSFGETTTGRFLASTPGFGWVFEALTGTPSKQRLDAIKEENENATRHALRNGVNPDGSRMTQADKAAAVSAAGEQTEKDAKALGAHHSQAELRGGAFSDVAEGFGFAGVGDAVTKAAKTVAELVPWVVLISAGGLTLFFGVKLYQSFRR